MPQHRPGGWARDGAGGADSGGDVHEHGQQRGAEDAEHADVDEGPDIRQVVVPDRRRQVQRAPVPPLPGGIPFDPPPGPGRQPDPPPYPRLLHRESLTTSTPTPSSL